MSEQCKDELLATLVDAIRRGDHARARQVASVAVAAGVSRALVEGILALGSRPAAEPRVDPERRLATDLDVAMIGAVGGRPAALTPAAQRRIGVGFTGSFEAALAELTHGDANDPLLGSVVREARRTGSATAALADGRYRVAAWATPKGQLRAAVVERGGEERHALETLATVNHEMANGVTALTSLAALARRPDTSDGEREDLLRRIEQTARDTLDAVKSTRRALRSHPPSELPPVDAAPLLRELLTTIEPTAAAAGVRLVAQIDDGIIVRVREAELRSVAWNLVKNAVEASRPGGEVRVRGQVLRDALQLVVSDEGAGMDEATLERAFDPFFTTKTDGSGLGLPLVRHIVQRAGGELEIDSRRGTGTRVTVTLPCVEALSGIQPISGVRARSPLAGLRALVVGADARRMAEALRSRGALLEDPQALIAAGLAVDLAIVGGVQGTLLLQALRPLAETVVWIGPGDPDAELVDARLPTPDVDALLDLLDELDPDHVAV